MELEDPEKTISQYLSENAPRIDDEGTPLREVISTPLLSAISNPHIRMIDFGVGEFKYSTSRSCRVGDVKR